MGVNLTQPSTLVARSRSGWMAITRCLSFSWPVKKKGPEALRFRATSSEMTSNDYLGTAYSTLGRKVPVMPEAARTKRRCASCGTTVRAKDRFCGSCGTPLGNAATVTASGQTSASLQVSGHAARLLGEQRKVVTVVFADLSGSTTLGERLDPEDLRRIPPQYFSTLAGRIVRYEGTVDKYIGDAVMAVFGAPVSHEDDAERAINAALAMQAAMVGLNAELERVHGVRLSLRIGVNTGEVVAGMLPGDVQAAYTAVGDAVNTAQRIE